MVFSKKEPTEEAAFKPESSPLLDETLWIDKHGKSTFGETCECLEMKFVGKPYAGKPHVRFDEGGRHPCLSLLYHGFWEVLWGKKIKEGEKMINNKKENNLNEINSSKQKMSLFKTVEAEKVYLYSYNEALKLWPVHYETHNIQTRYGSTHVIVSGPENADSIVLMHGFMFSSTMWFPNIAELSANYRVFAVDIIADFNKSIPAIPLINREDYKDWLIDVFNELEIEKANIIGHSFGGFLSASFAILAPERVKKIILLAPAATIVPLKMQLVLRAISAMVLPGQRIKENFLKWVFAKGFLINKNFREQFLCGLKYCNFLTRVSPSVFTDEELKQILVPTLFMVGDKEVVMTSNADAIIRAKKLISNIETEIVPNAGHLISMEQPSFINNSILKFLCK